MTFERFLAAVDNHARANILYDPSHFAVQGMDYLSFIDHYHERIRMFGVKDVELNTNGRSGVYGGYQTGCSALAVFAPLAMGRSISKAFFKARRL